MKVREIRVEREGERGRQMDVDREKKRIDRQAEFRMWGRGNMQNGS